MKTVTAAKAGRAKNYVVEQSRELTRRSVADQKTLTIWTRIHWMNP
jgi:hypothetical protein